MTTPKVEIGFKGPARATAFQLDDPVYGLLDSGVLGIGVELVDLSSRLVSLSVSRGKSQSVEPFQSGRATVVLRNTDGVLDPLNTASELYPGVEPRRPVNIYADDQQVYAGFVDDIDLSYSIGGDAVVTVTCSDGLSRISLADFDSAGEVFVEQDSGARIGAVLAAAPDLWSGDTDLDTGDSLVAAGTATGNILEYLQQVERSEAGFLYVSRDGKLTFRNRNNPAENPGALTVSDAGGTACTPYSSISRQAGSENLYNRVSAVHVGSTVIATDEDSVDDYGIRVLELGELLLTSVDATTDRVDYELTRRATAFTSVSQVTVDQSATQSGCSLTLAHDLAEAVTVIFTPPGVTQQVQSYAIIAVDHQWTVGTSWRTTFGLTRRDDALFLILNDVDYGLLDEAALAF